MRSSVGALTLVLLFCQSPFDDASLLPEEPPRPRQGSSLQETTTAPGAALLLQGVEKDLRVLERGQLTSGERVQRDHAKSLVRDGRRLLVGAKSDSETEALAIAISASTEVAPLVRRQLRLEELVSAADRYRAGDTSKTFLALSRWLPSDFDPPVRYIEENRDRLRIQATALADVDHRTLAALCLLQTDIAVQVREDTSARLSLARRLLAVADASRLPPRFVQRWYSNVATRLLGESRLLDAMQHLDDAVRRFPNDAEILVVAGVFCELLPPLSFELPERSRGGRVQNLQSQYRVPISGGTINAGSPPSSNDEDAYDRLVAARKAGYARAEEFYRRALAVEAGNAEAHLRLGRVLALTSRPDLGLAELRLAASSDAPRIRYLASMFEGAVHEGSARLEEALASYQQAVRACPNCLSGGIALSHAQRRTGAPEVAVQTLDAATNREAFPDYWWDYPLGAFRQCDVLMVQLRGSLR